MALLADLRLPILEAREKNRPIVTKAKAATEEKYNKQLRRLNLAIQAGMETEAELKASEKKTPEKVLS